MGIQKDRYFNFPIQLLNGFLVNKDNCLDKILFYALYEHSERLEHGEDIDRFKSAANYFGVNVPRIEKAHEAGKRLYELYSQEDGVKSPKVGIFKGTFFEYYDKDKSIDDVLTLLSFLALKSILGNQKICKTNNKFMFSRMAGMISTTEYNNLPKEFMPYVKSKDSIVYWSNKMRSNLENKWNILFYSYKMRGFYVSSKMTKEQLITEVELNRPSNIQALKKLEESKFRDNLLRQMGIK